MQLVSLVLLSSVIKAGLSFAGISASLDLHPELHPVSTRHAPAGEGPFGSPFGSDSRYTLLLRSQHWIRTRRGRDQIPVLRADFPQKRDWRMEGAALFCDYGGELTYLIVPTRILTWIDPIT